MKEPDNFPLFFLATGELDKDYFTTYRSCFDNRLSKAWKADKTSEGGNDSTGEFLSTAMPFFEQVEEGLDCSGVCWLPAFGIKRDISKGPPT